MAKKRTIKTGEPAAAKRKPSTRQIEKLDREILALLNRRAELAGQRDAKNEDAGVDRSALSGLLKHNDGPLSGRGGIGRFRELVSGSRAVSQVPRVAYLGPEHTFSHLAAIERFGQSAELVPVGTIAAAFEEVEQGQSEFGIVPVENSTDGGIVDTLECLVRSPVQICGEVPLHIHHCLLGKGARKDVRRVFSKPQALSQCRNWLSKHLPTAELVGVGSTTEAARRASTEKDTAAIASQQAGTNHGLKVLAKNIETTATTSRGLR